MAEKTKEIEKTAEAKPEKLQTEKAAAKPTTKERIESKAEKSSGGVVKKALETVKELREKPDEKKERKIKLERTYTIPIRQFCTRTRKTKNAVRDLRNFIQKHTKAKEIKIEQELNSHIWQRGYQKPPQKVRVNVNVDDAGLATVSLKKES